MERESGASVEAGSVRLGSGVPDLLALGAAAPEDFLGAELGPSRAAKSSLEGGERATLIERDAVSELWRYPLPGTPDADGRFRGRPRGAGTGWVYLRRYAGAPLAEGFRARFTRPRSESLAAREWNLICHLRAHGVGTPEPLAVGSAGSVGRGGFARRSFVVTRALDGMAPLAAWLAREPGLDERRRAARALGLSLARLFASGVRLADLGGRHLYLASADSPGAGDSDSEACAAREIATLQEAAAVRRASAGQLRWRRLPEVAVTGFRGGRIAGPPTETERAALLARLGRELGEVDGREALRVFHTALARGLPRDRRRAALDRVSGRDRT